MRNDHLAAVSLLGLVLRLAPSSQNCMLSSYDIAIRQAEDYNNNEGMRHHFIIFIGYVGYYAAELVNAQRGQKGWSPREDIRRACTAVLVL